MPQGLSHVFVGVIVLLCVRVCTCQCVSQCLHTNQMCAFSHNTTLTASSESDVLVYSQSYSSIVPDCGGIFLSLIKCTVFSFERMIYDSKCRFCNAFPQTLPSHSRSSSLLIDLRCLCTNRHARVHIKCLLGQISCV